MSAELVKLAFSVLLTAVVIAGIIVLTSLTFYSAGFERGEIARAVYFDAQLAREATENGK